MPDKLDRRPAVPAPCVGGSAGTGAAAGAGPPGGKENFTADRVQAAKLAGLDPSLPSWCGRTAPPDVEVVGHERLEERPGVPWAEKTRGADLFPRLLRQPEYSTRLKAAAPLMEAALRWLADLTSAETPIDDLGRKTRDIPGVSP